MRNRAKCRLCLEIIESFHENDYVSCQCDEIAISGGKVKYYTFAKDWSNFIRIDENDKELNVRIENENNTNAGLSDEGSSGNSSNLGFHGNSDLEQSDIEMPGFHPERIKKEEALQMLDLMIKQIEELPEPAMRTYVNHYDLYSFMVLVNSLFRSS